MSKETFDKIMAGLKDAGEYLRSLQDESQKYNTNDPSFWDVPVEVIRKLENDEIDILFDWLDTKFKMAHSIGRMEGERSDKKR